MKVRRNGDVSQVSFEIPWEADASRGSELHPKVSDLAFDWQDVLATEGYALDIQVE